ncbi:PX domain protein (macronuclear) [Tetrahymena thermophila SB210]|uniref:PX domain protein n=1 Tax=Tetrahymena thermophila (strain SB210) TaxID=312017 RepID=I7MEW3_TETTS|nr:PX domain protein [Tetrahymena thermophila SB210]EAR97919.2 PX domain protein [Tetrahymena thermophila SB210]|eukprot:XP_001018164.2 PX domain protein [Tetrahymena thermophila SB210]
MNQDEVQETIEQALSIDASSIQIVVQEPERKILSSVTYYPIDIQLGEVEKITVYKRYSEFEALYQVLEMKYHNFKFPELPSKLQVFNKSQTRKKSFQEVFDTILKYAVMYPEKRLDFIQSLFVFLLEDIKNKGKKRRIKKSFTLDNSEAGLVSPSLISQTEEAISEDSASFNDMKGISGSMSGGFTQSPIQQNNNNSIQNEIVSKLGSTGELGTTKETTIQNETQNLTPNDINTQENYQVEPEYTFQRRDAIYKMSICSNDDMIVETPVRKRLDSEDLGSKLFNSKCKEKEQEQITKIDEVESEEEKISNFNFKMQFKFYYKDKFDTYFVKFKGHDMLLYSKIYDSNFSKLICIHEMIIKKSETEENFIEMYHQHDYKPIQIQTTSQRKMNNLINQIEEYGKSTKFDSSNSFTPIGKVVMLVNRCLNIGIPNGEPVLIKLKTHHFTFESSIHIHTQNGIFIKQEFSFPISNPYETIYIEFYHLVNDSWLRKKLKENLIGRAKFNYIDMISLNAGYVIEGMILDIELVDDNQNNQKKKVPLKISVRNDTNRFSIFAKNPQGYEEGEKKMSSIDLFIVSFYRFRRIIGYISKFFQIMEDLFYFKYPKLSNLFFAIILLYVICCDPSRIFTHIFMLIALLCLSFQKDIRQKLDVFFKDQLLDQKNLFFAEPSFLTDDEELYEQMRNSFDKINIQKIVVEDNDDESTSIFQKYQNLKKKFTQIHRYLTTICNFCEKIKNIFTWKDPVVTTYLIIFLFLLCIIIHALPIRLFLIVVVLAIYQDGKQALKVRRNFNKQISLSVCEYSLRKNLGLSKDQVDFTKQWTKNEKLQKQITEDFYQHLQVVLWEGSLKIFDCPITLSEEISKCTTLLTLYAGDKIQASDQLFEEIRKQVYPKRSIVENIYYYLFNFIYNIPSDYYRLLNPNKIQQHFEEQNQRKNKQIQDQKTQKLVNQTIKQESSLSPKLEKKSNADERNLSKDEKGFNLEDKKLSQEDKKQKKEE